MDRRIVFFESLSGPWPRAISDQFQKNTSKFGVIYVEEGSSREREFVSLLASVGGAARRRTIQEVTGSALYAYPYHYLSVPDRANLSCQASFDYGTACDACGDMSLRIGAIQTKKLSIGPGVLKSDQMVQLSLHRRPSVILVSRALKEAMDSSQITGCQLIPCLDPDGRYSDIEVSIHGAADRLAGDARVFQLIVTHEVLHPPRAGEAEVFMSPCRSCGCHNGVIFSSTTYFAPESLGAVDMQYYGSYKTENLGEVTISCDVVIISARLLKLMIDMKARFVRYLTDPPIRHGVVDVFDD